jgi:cytochrome c biogenesis protein CcmG/thiol:disulfide interchange protein DsbE
MQRNQRIILYILLLIAGASWIVLSASPVSSRSPAGTVAPQVGFTAPDFSLNSPDGKKYTLSGLKGQAVLVNLWTTWCPPCRAEMPTIEKMYKEFKDKGFTVIAIDMTFQDDPSAVAPFTIEHGLTFPILLDETGLAASSYQLQSLPSSFFINRNGIIQDVIIGGPMSETLLRTQIEKILQ